MYILNKKQVWKSEVMHPVDQNESFIRLHHYKHSDIRGRLGHTLLTSASYPLGYSQNKYQDGGSTIPWNITNYIPTDMTTYPRTSLTLLWEPQIPCTSTSLTWVLWHQKCGTAVHLLWIVGFQHCVGEISMYLLPFSDGTSDPTCISTD